MPWKIGSPQAQAMAAATRPAAAPAARAEAELAAFITIKYDKNFVSAVASAAFLTVSRDK